MTHLFNQRFFKSIAAVLAMATVVLGTNADAKEQVGATSKAKTLEARLQRLEDGETIRVLLEHYMELNESRDYAAYSQLFAKDGELVMRRGSATGPEAIHKMLDQSFGGPSAPTGVSGVSLAGSSHVLSNIKIHVDGDTATATSRWTLLTRGEDNRARLGGTGHYGDQLVRENGQWKFKRRVIYRDIPSDAFPAK